jgi:hypothetical protein
MTPLTFRGYRIVEAKPAGDGVVCEQCAAFHKAFCCIDFFDAAESYFGGDCEHRDVIYAEATEMGNALAALKGAA